MIKDADSKAQLVDKMLKVIEDETQLSKLSKNILQLAEKDSADRIAEEILKLVAL
jgi:UDP-N-acetylglucosamine--N-acetylmuramyl-(pentapeptide) pyrophosphoryl-undecaprenol N-acetylglucosamine transferase